MESKKNQPEQTQIVEYLAHLEGDSAIFSDVQEKLITLIKDGAASDDSVTIGEIDPICEEKDQKTASGKSKLYELLEELADAFTKQGNENDRMRSLVRQLERKIAVAPAKVENGSEIPEELHNTFSNKTVDHQERQSDMPNSRCKTNPGATFSMDNVACSDWSNRTYPNSKPKTPSKASTRGQFTTSTPFLTGVGPKSSFHSCFKTPFGASMKKVCWSDRPRRPARPVCVTWNNATPGGDTNRVRTSALKSRVIAEPKSPIPKMQLNDSTIQSLASTQLSELDDESVHSSGQRSRWIGAGTLKKRRSNRLEGSQNAWIRKIRKPIKHRTNKAFILRVQSLPNFRHNHRTGSSHFYSRKRRISNDFSKKELIATVLQNADRD